MQNISVRIIEIMDAYIILTVIHVTCLIIKIFYELSNRMKAIANGNTDTLK